MKKVFRVFLIVALFAAITMAAFAGGKPQAGDKITFRMSHVFSVHQATHIALDDASKKITERTNGQIEIAIFPENQIAVGVDGVEQCIRGAYFINVYDPGCMGNWVPDYNALIGPMLYSNPEEYSAMCQTEFAKSLNRKAEQNGLKVLALDYNFGMRNVVMTKTQLKSINDLQGVKIRVPNNALWIDTFNALGAAPVGMVWSEVYNALQAGVVDALESSTSDIFDNQLNEVTKYVTKTAHFVGTGAVILSKAVWDKLTPEQQKIMEEEFIRGAKLNNDMNTADEAEAQKKLEALGMVFNEIDLTQFRQRAKTWFDNNKNITPGVYDTIMAELNKIRGK